MIEIAHIRLTESGVILVFRFNQFVLNALFLYALKTSENLTVFLGFQGVENGWIANKWVKVTTINIRLMDKARSKLIIKTLSGGFFRGSSVFVINLKNILYVNLVF